ncbi:MAG: glycosyltransferase family 39 protein [Endomicrobiaceae bacterium]|nr:glycosyltransferase family 39 protein [Endomicrobiaceae bacterium]
MLKKINLNKFYILLSILSILYLAGNIIWYLKNTPVLITELDSSIHFMDVFYNLPAYHAPLITFILKISFSIFGKTHFDLIIILLNYMFFIGSLALVFKITKTLKDENSGYVAMILFSLTPIIYVMSRTYGINDYHLIFPATLSIYTLIKSDFFRNSKWSFLYGISTAFGMMVKESFIIFFTGALLLVFIKILFLKEPNKKKIFLNILFVSLTVLILISFHYANPETIKSRILTRPFMGINNIFEVNFDFEKIKVFTLGLYEEMLSLPLFILFMTALFFYIKNYENKNKYILLMYFLFPWTILMIIPCNKIVVYGAAFIPAVSIITAIGLDFLQPKIKKILFLTAVSICLLQYMNFSYGINLGLDKHLFKYMNRDFFIYNTNHPTLFYIPELSDNYILKINETGEIGPVYDIKNCENLFNHFKKDNIKNGKIFTKNKIIFFTLKTFVKAKNIKNLIPALFEYFSIHPETDALVLIGENNDLFEAIITKENIFKKSEEFYLDSQFKDDNKVTVYKLISR